MDKNCIILKNKNIIRKWEYDSKIKIEEEIKKLSSSSKFTIDSIAKRRFDLNEKIDKQMIKMYQTIETFKKQYDEINSSFLKIFVDRSDKLDKLVCNFETYIQLQMEEIIEINYIQYNFEE